MRQGDGGAAADVARDGGAFDGIFMFALSVGNGPRLLNDCRSAMQA